MRKILFIILICVVFAIGLLVKGLFAKELTLSTYYPAPFGAYDRLKLVPRETLEKDPHCDALNDLGTMYYDNGKKEYAEGIYVCQQLNDQEFDWVYVSVPFRENANEVSNRNVVCVKQDGVFGVCANNPSFDGTCACF